MKELQYVGGTVVLDDRVADAVEALASALGSTGMSATIQIRPDDRGAAIKIDIGHNRASGRNHVLHAKSATGEGSHLGLEEI